MNPSSLYPDHLADLKKSGLDLETIRAAGIYSIGQNKIPEVVGWPMPINSLMAIPYPGNGFTRYRLFPPYQKNPKERAVKYFQPKGSRLHLYEPPGFDRSYSIIRITEGEKKALKGSAENLNVCGLGGIWNFADRDQSGTPALIEGLAGINWKGRETELIPDPDFLTKESVLRAVFRLGRMLAERGAKVRVVKLPDPFKLDDYLTVHPVNDFYKLERLPLEDSVFSSVAKKENSLAFPSWIIDGVAGKCASLYSSVLEAPEHFFYLAFLTCLGSILSGRLTLFSAIRPQPRLYALFLGESADDRKSTVLSQMVSLFKDSIIDFNVVWGVNSAEGLQKLFEKVKNILLVFDEFRLFVAKSKNEHSVLLPAATSLFETNHFETHTKTASVTIDDAHLAIMAASTVETFERIWDPAFTDIGFLNRLFIIPGSGLRKFSIPPPIPDSEKWRIKNELKEILAFVGDHKELELTIEAKARFDEWYLNQEASIYGKRLDGYALRFMSLLAVNSFKPQVDLETVEKVLSLVEWQRRVREALSPIDADSVTAKMEEKIRRTLKLGDKSESLLKRFTHAHRAGLWIFEAAKRNLQKAGEIGWNKSEKVYFLK